MAIATKINIQSKSPEFIEFIEKIDSILSKTNTWQLMENKWT